MEFDILLKNSELPLYIMYKISFIFTLGFVNLNVTFFIIKGCKKLKVPINILKSLQSAAYYIPNLKFPIKIASNITLIIDTAIFIQMLIFALPDNIRSLYN